jgi:hypothetical protein
VVLDLELSALGIQQVGAAHDAARVSAAAIAQAGRSVPVLR